MIKFHSVEEMSVAADLRAALPKGAPENLRVAFGLMSLAARLHPIDYEPGVRKFRSFDEAVAAREARLEAQAVQAARARARGPTGSDQEARSDETQ